MEAGVSRTISEAIDNLLQSDVEDERQSPTIRRRTRYNWDGWSGLYRTGTSPLEVILCDEKFLRLVLSTEWVPVRCVLSVADCAALACCNRALRALVPRVVVQHFLPSQPLHRAETIAVSQWAEQSCVLQAHLVFLAPYTAAIAARFEDSSSDVREAADRVLTGLGEHAAPHAAAIVARLEHDRRNVRTAAVWALTRLGEHAAPQVGGIVALLEHNESTVRTAALDALAGLGEHAAPHAAAIG
eukprot:SAG31_NODE_12621_length_929_cov_0.820482_1_plen_242_part_01